MLGSYTFLGEDPAAATGPSAGSVFADIFGKILSFEGARLTAQQQEEALKLQAQIAAEQAAAERARASQLTLRQKGNVWAYALAGGGALLLIGALVMKKKKRRK